jgi:general secretion pathway protein G
MAMENRKSARRAGDAERVEPEEHGAQPEPAEAGFTMVELLVVLGILVLIAAIAVPTTLSYLDRAKGETARVAMDGISTALDLYRLDVGRYPTEDEGLIALVEPAPGAGGWNGPYLKKRSMLEDPWGVVYRYRMPGQHGAYDLYTLGADGIEGGEDADADVVSWQ